MKTKLRKTYNIRIRLLVVVITIVFLYDQLFHRKDLSYILYDFNSIASGLWSDLILITVLALLPVNILIESIKWKYLISKIEKVSLWNSIKGVFAGISVSMIMPNRVGDYLGRVFILQKADRIQAVLSTILGSFAQLLTTLILGLIASIFYFPEYFDIGFGLNFWMYVGFIMVTLTAATTMVLAYLNFSVFSIIIQRISGKYYNKIEKYAEVFSWYNQRELFNVLVLSILRYVVFSFQFFLLLRVFNVGIDYLEAIMLIAIIYFLMTIIPTIALTEIGVRGSVSLYVFQHHFEALGLWSPELAVSVVSASSLLWLFNLVIPAVVGALFVFSLKFFRKNNDS
ncbi:MAG: flippase-like domain-containing protein [Bacteroidetes bacterium]|nr:flippase-like domain-containing protein [Bacteroidota bacterium]